MEIYSQMNGRVILDLCAQNFQLYEVIYNTAVKVLKIRLL